MIEKLLKKRFYFILHLYIQNTKYKCNNIFLNSNSYLKYNKKIQNIINKEKIYNQKERILWNNKYYSFKIMNNIYEINNFKNTKIYKKTLHDNIILNFKKKLDKLYFIDYNYSNYLKNNYINDLSLINKFYNLQLNKLVELKNNYKLEIKNINKNKINNSKKLKYNLYLYKSLIIIKKRNIVSIINNKKKLHFGDLQLNNINKFELNNLEIQFDFLNKKLLYLEKIYLNDISNLTSETDNQINLINENINDLVIKIDHLKNLKIVMMEKLDKNISNNMKNKHVKYLIINLLQNRINNLGKLNLDIINEIKNLDIKLQKLFNLKKKYEKVLKNQMEKNKLETNFLNKHFLVNNKILKPNFIENNRYNISYLNNINNLVEYLR